MGSKFKWPIIEVFYYEGDASIIGVYGRCGAISHLKEMEKEFNDYGVFDGYPDCTLTLKITERVEDEREGYYLTMPGYFEFDELSRVLVVDEHAAHDPMKSYLVAFDNDAA